MQPESSRCFLPGRLEALPIIRDGEDDGLLLRMQIQRDRRVRGTGVIEVVTVRPKRVR